MNKTRSLFLIGASLCFIQPATAQSLPECGQVLKSGMSQKGCIMRTTTTVAPDQTGLAAPAVPAQTRGPVEVRDTPNVESDPAITQTQSTIEGPSYETNPSQTLGVLKEPATSTTTSTQARGREQMDIDRNMDEAQTELSIRAESSVHQRPKDVETLDEVEQSFDAYRNNLCKLAADYERCYSEMTNAHVRRLDAYYDPRR